jgi:hypothetical protein
MSAGFNVVTIGAINLATFCPAFADVKIFRKRRTKVAAIAKASMERIGVPL